MAVTDNIFQVERAVAAKYVQITIKSPDFRSRVPAAHRVPGEVRWTTSELNIELETGQLFGTEDQESGNLFTFPSAFNAKQVFYIAASTGRIIFCLLDSAFEPIISINSMPSTPAVPTALVGNDGGRDSLIFHISEEGLITNWPETPSCSDFIDNFWK
jgi:hypothetical protein